MAAKKKKKKYRGFWIFVKVQFVLSLLVLGGLGYYVLGGYASEVSSIRKEADSLVRNSTEETFRRYRTSVVYAADGSVISRLNDQGASYYLKRDEIPQPVIDAVVCMGGILLETWCNPPVMEVLMKAWSFFEITILK